MPIDIVELEKMSDLLFVLAVISTNTNELPLRLNFGVLQRINLNWQNFIPKQT